MENSVMDHEDDVAALLSALPLDTLDDLADMPLPSLFETVPLEELQLEPFNPTDAESAEDSQSSHDAKDAGLKHKPKRTRRVRPSAYDSNRARNQRRHELAYLRSRVDEMEKELALVRARGHRVPTVTTKPQEQKTSTVTTTSALTTVMNRSVWEPIAVRQLKERRRAETENERLKAALETQLKVAKSLEAILHKRSTTQSLEGSGVGNYTRVYAAPRVSDTSVFEMLLKDAHAIYTDAERLVGNSTPPVEGAPDGSGPDARLRATESGLLVEIFAVDLLPFTLQETSTAAWQYFSHNKNHLPEPSRLYYERISDDSTSSEDTVIERTCMEFVTNGVKAVMQLQQVLRRYEEPDRVVVVWNAIAQPEEFDAKPFSGFDLRQWGCMVLTRQPPSGGHGGDVQETTPLTVLRSCFFITPEFQIDNVGEMTGDGDVGRLTEFILTATANSVASWRQRIENILLDNHLQASANKD